MLLTSAQQTALCRRFVSDVDLDQITGISHRTWKKHRLFNRGPRYYKIYGAVRYDLDEVLAWIRSQAVGDSSMANVGVEAAATVGSAGAAA